MLGKTRSIMLCDIIDVFTASGEIMAKNKLVEVSILRDKISNIKDEGNELLQLGRVGFLLAE